jgi:hypothetical protein
MKKLLFIFLLCFFSIINVYSQANVIFDSLADMTSKRYGMGYASDGTHIFAVSGGTNMEPWLSTTLERYNIANNTWSEYVTGLLPRRYNSAEYISTLNKLFIFNGYVHQFFTVIKLTLHAGDDFALCSCQQRSGSL